MPRRPPTAVACLLAPLLLAATAACGSSSSAVDNAGGVTSPHPTPVNCPSPAPVSTPFPDGASSDLPRPPSATAPEQVPVQVHGVTLLRFTTAMPLRDAVAFLLDRYPAAGYRLLTGDSEEHEADAPFVKGGLHGTTRLSGTGPCSTTWLVAVTKGNARLDKIPQLAPHDKDSDSDSDSGDSDSDG
jgi:hypothetical protein